jgi:hypothetical protein
MRGRLVALGLLTFALTACSGSATSAPADGPAPATLRVTCTQGTGIEVAAQRVRTSVDGVHLQVVDRSGHADTALTIATDTGTSGQGLTDHGPWLLAVAPGAMRLSCSPSPFDDGDRGATVQVVDPERHWTVPTSDAELGCTRDGELYPGPPVPGRTELEALDGLVAANYDSGTRTYEVRVRTGGYDTGSSYGFVLVRNGSAVATGLVLPTADEGWEARLDGVCAERDQPPSDPPSPAPAPTGPPTTLHVTCSPTGATVAAPQVRTSPDGVRLEVDNRSGWSGAGPFLVYGNDAEQVGGDRVTASGLSPLTALTPGKLFVGCTPDYTSRPDPATLTTVTVVDPDHNWRPARLMADCRPSGMFYAEGQGEGPTEQAALTDLLDHVPAWRRSRMRLYDDGFWRVPGHMFLVLRRSHGEYLYGAVLPQPDGTWKTTNAGTCDPDRLPSP